MPGGPTPAAGVLAVTEGHDVFAGAGSACTGFLTVTEGHDTAAIPGVFTIPVTLAGTGRADVFAGVSSDSNAIMARTEGHDTALVAGWYIAGAIGYAEHHDVLAGLGAFATAAAMARTEGHDTAGFAGIDRAYGSAGPTGGNDTATIAGLCTFHAVGSLIAGGADVFAGLGFYGPPGVLSRTEGHDVFAGAGAIGSSAAIGVTERHDTMRGGSSNLEYNIYSNTGIADPIDYTTAIATTGLLTWTSDPLAFPGIWRFGVRAFDPLSSLEEENLDAAVTIILDAAGVDITNRPLAPIGLRALARPAAAIRAEWAYPVLLPSGPRAPTGFHLYYGTAGTPDYTTIRATVPFTASIAGTFVRDLTGLSDGTTYTIGVRAYNATAEEPNTVTVSVLADSTGPSAVVDLAAIAI